MIIDSIKALHLRSIVLMAVLAGAPAGDAQELSGFDKVLLPVTPGSVEGAFGSRWVTSLTIGVHGSTSTEIGFRAPGPCQLTCATIPIFSLPGGTTTEFSGTSAGDSGRGIFLYLEPSVRSDVTLRVRDTSRSAESFGVSIPVVERSDLYGSAFGLVGIPNDDRFRSTLRVYDFSPEEPGRVEIRLYRTGSPPEKDHLVRSTTHLLSGSPEHLLYPGFHQETLPPSDGTGYRIEIQPLDQSTDYWAFVSVTNNATQEVTLILPR